MEQWNRKGVTLSDVTARKEYGVSQEFIVKGIRAGKLEYREGSIWANPYLKILRSQLESYIGEQQGSKHLAETKAQAELRKINKEVGSLKLKLDSLSWQRSNSERPNRQPSRAFVTSGIEPPTLTLWFKSA